MTDLVTFGHLFVRSATETMKLPHKVNLHSEGVNHEFVQWCIKNCSDKWGWYFDSSIGKTYGKPVNYNAILAFNNLDDALFFKISCFTSK